jgi:hypothetical protein
MSKSTYHGLHQWFKRVYERLGWMVLSHHKGYDDKIICYKNEIKRLESALKDKIKTIKDEDKKEDLKILLDYVKVLKEHVKKDF